MRTGWYMKGRENEWLSHRKEPMEAVPICAPNRPHAREVEVA